MNVKSLAEYLKQIEKNGGGHGNGIGYKIRGKYVIRKGVKFSMDKIANFIKANQEMLRYGVLIHSRLASTSKVSDNRCHPILSPNKRYAIIHNGTLSNHYIINTLLKIIGYHGLNDHDTKTLATLIEMCFDHSIFKILEISFGAVIIQNVKNGMIYAIREGYYSLTMSKRGYWIATEPLEKKGVLELETNTIVKLNPRTNHYRVLCGELKKYKPKRYRYGYGYGGYGYYDFDLMDFDDDYYRSRSNRIYVKTLDELIERW